MSIICKKLPLESREPIGQQGERGEHSGHEDEVKGAHLGRHLGRVGPIRGGGGVPRGAQKVLCKERGKYCKYAEASTVISNYSILGNIPWNQIAMWSYGTVVPWAYRCIATSWLLYILYCCQQCTLRLDLGPMLGHHLHDVDGHDQGGDGGNDADTDHEGQVDVQPIGEDGQGDAGEGRGPMDNRRIVGQIGHLFFI